MDHFYTGLPVLHMGAYMQSRPCGGRRHAWCLALTLSDRQYQSSVGIDPKQLSKSGEEEVIQISRYEEELLDDFLQFAAAVRKRTDLVVPIAGPSAPHRCSDDLLLRCKDIARDLDTAIHIHVCETRAQFLQGRQLFGRLLWCISTRSGFLAIAYRWRTASGRP